MKNNKLWTVLAAVATVVASFMATSACFFFIYQPEEPSSLSDK